MNWESLDRLRAIFLAETKPRRDYWRTRADLEAYDATFAQRIGWKWNAVLAELQRLNWTPPADSVLDWGCGSGIAGRLVRDFFGIRTLRVFDRSELAMDFTGEQRWRGEPPGVLVLSHVLNELRELPDVIEKADAVLWVEPGTHADSRALIAVREKVREAFHIVAPCTHRSRCGMLTPENDRHWCHFFAKSPAGVMADPDWVRFAKRAGIDLRSLPYSYLVLDRRPSETGGARVIGAPRFYRGHAKILNCQAEGVREETVQKRDDLEYFRQLKKGVISPASAEES